MCSKFFTSIVKSMSMNSSVRDKTFMSSMLASSREKILVISFSDPGVFFARMEIFVLNVVAERAE